MLRTLEISWLVLSIFGAGFACYKFFTESLASGVYVLFFTGVAFGIYLIRRRQRVLMDREKERNKE